MSNYEKGRELILYWPLMLAAEGRPNALAPTLAAEIGLPLITCGTRHGETTLPQTEDELLVANSVVLIPVMFARLKTLNASARS